MIHPERVHYRKEGMHQRGDHLIYWMQHSQRAEENHALEYAIIEANRRRLPFRAVACIDPGYPSATARSYRFMIEGLAETEAHLGDRGIPLLTIIGDPVKEIPRITEDASLLIMDRGYLRHERQIRNDIIGRTECSIVEVESDIVVPVRAASIKEEWSAATLRRKITPQIPHFLTPMDESRLRLSMESDAESGVELADTDGLLRKIGAYEPEELLVARGGRSEAVRRLHAFLAAPASLYDMGRNDPGREVTSGLSPYLHFGQISPLEVARAAVGRSGFLEELIVRRELAINFVWYNEQYDSISCLPKWAETTLQEHARDTREYLYSYQELEQGDTHDPYWNAAQKEMVLTGKMHNYMRMYWGKKILEWSETPEAGYSHAIRLNDAYELDGRDPNGYAGVAWCFGKHDRAWKERPVFGKVRYMNANGLLRKGDIAGYLERVDSLSASTNQ